MNGFSAAWGLEPNPPRCSWIVCTVYIVILVYLSHPSVVFEDKDSVWLAGWHLFLPHCTYSSDLNQEEVLWLSFFKLTSIWIWELGSWATDFTQPRLNFLHLKREVQCLLRVLWKPCGQLLKGTWFQECIMGRSTGRRDEMLRWGLASK